MDKEIFTAVLLQEASDSHRMEDIIQRAFLLDVSEHLQSLGFDVILFDSNSPDTPPFADIWISLPESSHILKNASAPKLTINLGECDPIEIDDDKKLSFDYTFTNHMRDVIDYAAEKAKSIAKFQEAMLKLADKMTLTG